MVFSPHSGLLAPSISITFRIRPMKQNLGIKPLTGDLSELARRDLLPTETMHTKASKRSAGPHWMCTLSGVFIVSQSLWCTGRSQSVVHRFREHRSSVISRRRNYRKRTGASYRSLLAACRTRSNLCFEHSGYYVNLKRLQFGRIRLASRALPGSSGCYASPVSASHTWISHKRAIQDCKKHNFSSAERNGRGAPRGRRIALQRRAQRINTSHHPRRS